MSASQIVSVRLPDQVVERVKKLAQTEEKTVSTVVREAVMRGFGDMDDLGYIKPQQIEVVDERDWSTL